MTRINPDLTVPQAIRLHGDTTEKLEYHRRKLGLIQDLRRGVTEEVSEAEQIIGEAIRDYEAMQRELAAKLGY